MRNNLKTLAVAVGFTMAAATLATSAQAVPLLSFGQVGTGNTVVATSTGGTSTTLTATNAAISITQIDAAIVTPTGALLTFNFSSNGAASSTGGFVTQHFSGTFCITSAAGCGGTNYLSGSLIDVAFGQNTAFTLFASTPPSGDVTFTSSVIPAADLGLDRGASFSFANVTPGLHIDGSTIASFTSTVTGTFSGNNNPVPEPISLSLMGVGLVGLGMVRRARGKKA